MLNQTILCGNLGDNAKEFFSSEGVPVTSFNIAFSSFKKKTCWIKVVTFNKLAEICAKLKKGNRIGVTGVLDVSKWTDKEGNTHNAFQIIANNIEFIRVDESVFKDEEAMPETVNDGTPF